MCGIYAEVFVRNSNQVWGRMMDEHKVDFALDDIFEWGKIAGYAQDGILAELRRCVEQHCTDEDIPISQVNLYRTIANARVVLVVEPVEKG